VLNAVNLHRIAVKNRWDNKFRPSVNDITKYPTFFSDLEVHITNVLKGKPQKIQTDMAQEIQRIRGTYVPPGDANPDATINGSVPARRYLISAILDHVGHAELVAWASPQGMPT
jgi:hypothetical protein